MSALTRQEQLFESILRSLRRLGFHAIAQVNIEALCAPGSFRLEVIEFLCRRYDPGFTCDDLSYSSRIAHLIDNCYRLGMLYSRNVKTEKSIVEGDCEPEAALDWLDELALFVENSYRLSASNWKERNSGQEQALFDHICSHNVAILSQKSELPGAPKSGAGQKLPSTAAIRQQERIYLQEDAEQSEMLQEIRQRQPALTVASSQEATANLRAALLNYGDLLARFNNTYNTDFRSWTQNPAPKVTTAIGPAAARTLPELMDAVRLMEDLRTVSTVWRKVEEDEYPSCQIDDAQLNALRSAHAVLQSSVGRKQRGGL